MVEIAINIDWLIIKMLTSNCSASFNCFCKFLISTSCLSTSVSRATTFCCKVPCSSANCNKVIVDWLWYILSCTMNKTHIPWDLLSVHYPSAAKAQPVDHEGWWRSSAASELLNYPTAPWNNQNELNEGEECRTGIITVNKWIKVKCTLMDSPWLTWL